VTVDGAPGQLNTFVSAAAEVALDGQALSRQRLAYVLLHKPSGVVTTARDPAGRPTSSGSSPTPAASYRWGASTPTRRGRCF